MENDITAKLKDLRDRAEQLLREGLKDLKDRPAEDIQNIIDVLERPDLAQHERIIATPTLIKTVPSPIMRIIGDLSDKEKVLLKLDVVSQGE